jgi:hypothetical protein
MYSDYRVGLYFITQIESMLKLERENVTSLYLPAVSRMNAIRPLLYIVSTYTT